MNRDIVSKYFDFVTKFIGLLDRADRVRFGRLMVIALTSALVQATGIALVIPFTQLVLDRNIIASDSLLKTFYVAGNFSDSKVFVVCFGVITLLVIIVGNLLSSLLIWSKYRFVWNLHHKISTKLLTQYIYSPYEYFLNHNTSDLGKNILSEVQELTLTFLTNFVKLSTSAFTTLVIFIVLFYVNPVVTLGAVGMLMLFYLIIFLSFAKKLKESGKKRLEANKKRFKIAYEALGGVKDVKILGKENYFIDDFSQYSQQYSQLQAWYEIAYRTPRYIMEIVAFGGIISLILVLIMSGNDSLQIIPLMSFFAFAGYRLIPALQEIFSSFTAFRFNKAILNRIHEDSNSPILKKNRTSSSSSKSIKALPFTKKIEIKNLCFSYENSAHMVLKNINLTIKKNTTVALIGATGSGKSTLVDTLLGLLHPTSGEITVDGRTIRNNLDRWQKSLGYVPQSIYLADDTIAHNIAFGVDDEDIDMAQVEKVSKIVNLDYFISKELSDGYQTEVGERGVRLSGGQRQRLGIARALYHDPEILLLDEATNALDSVTEQEVLAAIKSISGLKTLIMISHKLSTVTECDVIYILEAGRIVTSGNYKTLLAEDKIFKELVENELER